MKKVLLLVCVVITVMLASCGSPKEKMYTREELEEAIWEAEREAYERGYDEGDYYARGEFERAADEYLDLAYEAGYEIGYEDGYYDCLEEHGLTDSNFESDDFLRIEKDRD